MLDFSKISIKDKKTSYMQETNRKELISTTYLPDKVALVCDGQRLTYSDIEKMANRMANALIEHGVKRGDRVVIYLKNSIEAVVSIFAILKCGSVFVVLNPTTKRAKLAYILNDCTPTALITDAWKAPITDKIASKIPILKIRIFCGEHAAKVAAEHKGCVDFDTVQKVFPDNRPSQCNIDLDLACLIYTSGSTGHPKGVMCSHSNVVFVTNSIIEYLQNKEDDIVINTLPLSFDYGLYQLLTTFKFGGTLVLEKGFTFPVDILKRIEGERVTGLPGVPALFAILLQMDLSSYDLSSLRYITNTGEALPSTYIAKIKQIFKNVSLYLMYGLTETKRALYLPPDQLDQKPGSVGIAIPGTEVWLEDKDGNRLEQLGEIGELVVRGRHVMRGYWNDQKATKEVFRPGPFPGELICYTGDLFIMDKDRYMYFVGRKDDIIKSGGQKVAPKEVEEIIYQLPGVVEAAVVGVPDPILGQVIKVFIVSNGGSLTKGKVIAHCRANLEDFMVPKYVEFTAELPKTSSNKIKKIGLIR